jgi:hypothetical protein
MRLSPKRGAAADTQHLESRSRQPNMWRQLNAPVGNNNQMPNVSSGGMSMGGDIGGAVQVDVPIQNEHLSLSRSDITIQNDWLDRAEEALRKLRPQVEAALIDHAEAELKVVRVDPASSEGWNRLKMSIGKIVERLAINASNEAIHEGIHELIKLLF